VEKNGRPGKLEAVDFEELHPVVGAEIDGINLPGLLAMSAQGPPAAMFKVCFSPRSAV